MGRPLGRLKSSCSRYVLRYRVIGNSSCDDPHLATDHPAADKPNGLCHEGLLPSRSGGALLDEEEIYIHAWLHLIRVSSRTLLHIMQEFQVESDEGMAASGTEPK